MFVETTKGRKFGGYTNIGFVNSNSNCYSDNNAFLISFDKLKTYVKIQNQNPNYAICYSYSSNYLSSFYSHSGYHNILINDNFFSNKGYTAKKGDCYYTSEVQA